jgi:dehydratase family protein
MHGDGLHSRHLLRLDRLQAHPAVSRSTIAVNRKATKQKPTNTPNTVSAPMPSRTWLRGAGPVGAPGMPEWGNLPIPKALLRRGVRDMVRICDGRMSGTHYGTCVLHVSPEAAIGGPLALLRSGDLVCLDAPAGRLDMFVDATELAARRAAWQPPPSRYPRSYAALYQAHVGQASEGCDFDFLAAPGEVPEPAIF